MVFLELGTLRNAQLLQEPIKSLCAAVGLHGSIRLLHEFSDGFSETRVVLGENRSGPNDLQPFHLVLKIGMADALRDEVSRYLDFIAHAKALAAFVPIWKPDLTLNALPPDGTLAAIAYANASDVFGAQDCVSFKSAFRECIRGVRPVPEVAGMIESLARVIGSLYSAPMHCFANEIALYYLEHWAADYQVVTDSLAETGGYPLLTLQRLNPSYFRQVKTSDGATLRQESESPGNGNQLDIVLPRCTVAKFERDQLVAWLNSPEDLALQIDTRELSPVSSAQLSKYSTISLWAPKKVSRYDFYLRHVRLGLPSLDVGASTFKVGPICLHNPLKHFSAPLLAATKPPASTFIVPGHGDLHPGNVLIAGTSPAIIDYGKSVTKIPVGADAARFFGGLVRDVLAEELSFEDLAIVLAGTLGINSFSEEADSPVSRAVRLLKLVVEKLIPANVPEAQTLWPVHLYGYAWIGLKWPHSSSEAYRACFLLAGVALQCLLGPATTEEESPPSALPSCAGEEKPAQPITATRPIKPEGPAEILILVSRFDGTADFDPTVRIYSTLADNVFEILPGLARAERVEEVISSRKDAVEMAHRYRASMIVWGTFDNMGVSPHYEVTRDSLVIKRSMVQLDQATRHKLSERFEPYITQNLAAEVSFLSLKAVAEMCVLNLNAALKVYDRALSLIPDRERARELGATDMYRSVAAIYFALKQNEQAVEANDKAREFDPNDLATEIQGLQIRAIIEKKSGVQQIEAFKRLLRARVEAKTDEPEVIEALQAILAKLEPLRTSADFRKFLESELPNTPPPPLKMLNKQFEKDVAVHLQRAEELVSDKKFPKALSEIRSALRLNPRCVEALTLRSKVFAFMDRVEEALKELEKAERLNAKHFEIYRIRGYILCDSKQDYQGALQQFEKAFELEEAVKQLILPAWGNAMIQLGRGEEAMQLVRDWNLNPGDPDLFIFRSQYYRKKGDYEAALRETDQAIQLDDETPWISLKERAEVYEAMGRREHAIQDLEQAIESTFEGTFTIHALRQRLDELRSLSARTEGEVREVVTKPESHVDAEGEKAEQESETDA
jgi:tetratricopeptide (TPR) repeat protein